MKTGVTYKHITYSQTQRAMSLLAVLYYRFPPT